MGKKANPPLPATATSRMPYRTRNQQYQSNEVVNKVMLVTYSQESCTRNFQNRNSRNLFPRRHHNNNNVTALHKATFTLPLTSPLLCFSILMQMNV